MFVSSWKLLVHCKKWFGQTENEVMVMMTFVMSKSMLISPNKKSNFRKKNRNFVYKT